MKFLSSLFFGSALFAGSLSALQTGSLTDEGYGNFYQGDLKNLSLSNLGELEAAPLVSEVLKLDQAVVWAAIPDGRGNLILGTGNDGEVVRLSPEGETEVLFAPDMVLTRALAVAPDGSIFVGTSPNGAIYRLPPDGGKPEVFLDLPDVYIWNFVLEGQVLWITTGFEARLLRVPLADDFQSAGEIEEWFRSSDDHFTNLVRDGERWILGAANKGIIYEVREEGRGFALAEVADEEIRSLAIGADGLLYFTTFSGGDSGSTGGSSVADGDLPPLVVSAKSGGGDDSLGSSYLYRLEDNGFTSALWRSSRSGLYSLTRFSDAYWLAGTNDDGKIFYFADRDNWGLQQELPQGGEVSVITPSPDGSGAYLLISSNPAVVYRLGGASEEASVFESRVLDARQPVRWGGFHLTYSREGPHTIETRVGNTEEPDATWSDWSELDAGSVASPVGRYLQYKVDIPGDSPVRFLRTRAFYQMPNAAPRVSAVRVLNFGAELQVTANMPTAIDFAAAFREGDVDKFESGGEDRYKLIRRQEQTFRTIVWRASDPNGDELVFDLFLRKAGAAHWTTLARDLTDPTFILNAAGLESGLYQVKVSARDGRSNPPDQAKTFSKVSSLVLLDATPPAIRLLAERSNPRQRVIEVSSDAAALVAAQVTLDGGDAVRVRPEDGIFDQLTETFVVTLPADFSAGGSILFEALDESGNQALWTENIE